MSIRNYLQGVRKVANRAGTARWLEMELRKRRQRFVRLGVECLESRLAPAVSLVNNFDGLVGGSPPDTTGAAGPNSYLGTVNSSVAIYNKSTNATIASDSLSHFLYTTGGITPADSYAQLSDATMVYDEPIGRFVVADLDVDRNTPLQYPQAPSQIDIAVSKSSNPTDLSAKNWTFFVFHTSEGTLWSDYPGNLGYNADALVFTFNMYGSNGGSFQHVQVDALSQSDLAAGTLSGLQFDVNGFTWRPVTMHDSTAGGPMWFVRSSNNGGNTITLERIDNILTSPTVNTFSIGVNSYGAVNAPLNPDGSVITTQGVDARIYKAAERFNEIVASQTVGVGSNEDDARWYEFNVSNINSPYLVQQGNIGYGLNTYTVYPAVDINQDGDIGMGFTKSGTDYSTDYMSAYITGHRYSDTLDTMEAPVEVRAGDSDNPGANTTGGREGDFSGINVDPIDGTFWVTDEFITGGKQATEVANFAMNASFSLNNGQLSIYGDQLGANYDDYIRIDTNRYGGVTAILDGEADVFAYGIITSIYINPEGGDNTVQISNVPANCHVNVDGPGVNHVTIGNSNDGVRGINSTVFVYNGYPTPSSTGYTALTIDDSADSGGRNATLNDTPYGNGTSFQEGSLSGLAPANIYWFDNSSGTYTGGVESLAIYGGKGGNTFTVANDGNLYSGTYLNAGAGFNTVYIQNTSGPLYVDSGSGVQSVQIGNNGSMKGIDGWVDVYNSSSSGYSYLYLDDSADPNGHTVNMYNGELTGLSTGNIYWTPTASATGGVIYLDVKGSGGGSTYTVNNTSNFYEETILQTGGGNDTVNVLATQGALLVINSGGYDSIYIGSTSATFGTGTMANIHGYVDVYGAGSTYLYLDDSADPNGHTVNLYNGELTGLSPGNIYWSATASATGGVIYLDVRGSGGGSTYTVNNTSNFYYYTFLQTGTGNDTVNILATQGGLYDYNSGGQDYVYVGSGGSALNGTMANINGFVDVYGAGSTFLYLGDSADTKSRTVNMYNGEVTGLAPANIYWTPTASATGGVRFLVVYGGSGGNTFNIEGTAAGDATDLFSAAGNDGVNVQATGIGSILNLFTLNVNAGGNADKVDLGSKAPNLGGTLANIYGTVNISNLYGQDYLTVDDDGDQTASTNVVVTSTGITGLGTSGVQINYVGSGIGLLGIDGGSGANTFTIKGTPLSRVTGEPTTFILPGTGHDTTYVEGASASTSLVIDGESGLNDRVIVGSNGPGGNSTLAGLVGVASIAVENAGGGHTALTIDDSGDTNAQTYYLETAGPSTNPTHEFYIPTYAPGSGAVLVTYGIPDITSLTIKGGSGGGTFNVQTTQVTTNFVGGGNTTVNVGNNGSVQGITGTLNLENPLAFNAITVNDSNDTSTRTATASTLGTNPSDSQGNTDPWGTLSGLAPAAINYEYTDTSSVTIDLPNAHTVNSSGGEVGSSITVTPIANSLVYNINGNPSLGAPGNSLIVSNALGTVVDHPTGTYAGYFTFQNSSTAIVNYTGIQSPTPIGLLVASTDAGVSPEVKVYNAQTGDLKFDLHPFTSSFLGGVRVAVGDLNGDGIPDIITAEGPSGSTGDSLVQVFDGFTGQQLAGPLGLFDPFPGFHGGLWVASAALVPNGYADLIVGQGSGGQGLVNIYSGQTGQLIAQFQPYGPGYTNGVRVAAGPVTSNGHVDVVTGEGAGGAPLVDVFDGPGLLKGNDTLAVSFNAFDPSFHGGVFVATGLIAGQGKPPAEIVVGEGRGGEPYVNVFTGAGTQVGSSFLAFDARYRGGVRVATADVTGAGRSEIVAVQGPGYDSSPEVRYFDGVTFQPVGGFLAFGSNYHNGMFVAGGGRWGLFNPALLPASSASVVQSSDAAGASPSSGSSESVFSALASIPLGLDLSALDQVAAASLASRTSAPAQAANEDAIGSLFDNLTPIDLPPFLAATVTGLQRKPLES